MPFPKNNLPSSSLPWGREVENQLESLKDTVYKNEVNNSARDATSQTNIKNINNILADQLQLKTYITETNPNTKRSKTYTNGGGEFLDTSDLTQTITLDKPRTLVIQYSAQCRVRNTCLDPTQSYSWYILSQIYVNGTRVSYADIQKSRTVGGAVGFANNPYSQEYDSQQMINIKRVKLPAGTHTISVTIDIGCTNPLGTTDMTVDGDDLSVAVVQ